jgi:hypothetical protein
MKLPVIKKGKKYYNTLTNKYVSESYAKRINNYFKKYPKSNLVKAGGHGKYKKKRPLYEHERTLKRKMYGSGFQVYKTKDIKGQTIYYSPVHNKELSKKVIDYIEKLDYSIAKNVKVELFRMSRDRERIYHLITWTVDKSFNDSRIMELWIPYAEMIYKKIENEIKKIIRKYPIGYSKFPIIYAHVSNYFYTDLSGYSHGKSFGFYLADSDGFSKLYNAFIETLSWYINKLEIMAYHNIWIEKFTFYIMDFYKSGTLQENISQYRLGINRPQS